MKLSDRPTLKVFLMMQAMFVATASAHPGPPGHTHGDEWPFGFLLAGLGVIVVLGLLKKGRARR